MAMHQVLAIFLTDTFGTPNFFEAFKKPISSHIETISNDALSSSDQAVSPSSEKEIASSSVAPTYAQAFTGVRQDSGDPAHFIQTTRDFYHSMGIPNESKTIFFSDSLNIDLCLKYKRLAEACSFKTSFGIGTYFTNDFVKKSSVSTSSSLLSSSYPSSSSSLSSSSFTETSMSAPLNIVIKLSQADGKPAIKISDNIGKNTGDPKKVEEVKHRLGYVEREWRGGNESHRWDQEQQEEKKKRKETEEEELDMWSAILTGF